MKRPAEAGKGQKGKIQGTDTQFIKNYPTISQYLLDGFWDDGKAREPSSLSIRMDGASVHISLSDHALQVSAYTAGPTLEDTLALLEAALAGGQVAWRPWKTGKGR